ncbi:MAG TPA: extracellular solute-binding protein [Chloroflexota bacterium]|nr:extracellular solute-binding protein [Chloroflexota bacterium]
MAGSKREQHSRRAILWMLASLAPTTALAACGSTQQANAPAQSAQTGGTKTLPPATIGWDTFRGFTPPTEWPKMMVETFQAKHPNIKVEARPIALEGGNQQSAYPKMLSMASAGTLGEVHAWDPSHWQLYQAVRKNIIQPIDSFIARDKFDLNQYYKVFIDYQKWEGKTWGLPSWGWTGQDGLFYNTELAQAAGITFPAQNSPDWTFAKLYDLAVKMGKFLERTGGFGMATSMPSAAGTTILTRGFDADNLSPDGKKSTLLEAKPKEGMKWVYDLANKERAVVTPGKLEGSDQDNFLNGKIGIWQQGSLGVANVNKVNQGGMLKFKAQLFPKRRDGKRPSQLRGGTWNILRGAPNADHAWEFIKHITSREGALLFNTIGGNGALVRPDIMSDQFFQDPNFRVYLENFENTMLHIVPANFRGTEFESAFGRMGTPWYKGEVGFEDGLIQWNTELQRILDLPPE